MKLNSYYSLQNLRSNQLSSTMGPSISGSKKRSYSPPLPTSPPPMSNRPNRLSLPEEPLYGFPSPPPRSIFEERSKKRRRIEERRNKSLLYGFQLQPYAAKILQSNDIFPLQEAIKDYIQPKKLLPVRIFESFAHHYPNAFALKLAKLIQVHPPLLIRIEAVGLLHHIFSGNSKINSSMLIELKKPLLHSIKVESEESLLPPLCETICLVAARLYDYPLDGWEEFLQYVCDCFSDESNEMKGLMLVAEMPLEVSQNKDFWLGKGNYDLLFRSILKLCLLALPNHKLKALTFDASITLMGMSTHLGRAVNVGDTLLPILLKFIDQQGEEEVVAKNEIVLSKLRRLAELVSLGVPEIFEAKEDDVFWCMIRVAEKKGASEEVKVAAVIVLSKLDELSMDVMENFLYYLSPDEIKRVVAVALDMMTYIVEDPLWYEVDNKDCVDAGMTEAFDRGKLLLNWLSFQGNEGVVIPTIIEMIRMRSSTHIDWRVRHAAMIAIGTIGGGVFEGDMVEYFDQVVNLVLNSLNDENHRVLWATMHAIKCLSGYKELLTRAQYHALLAKLIPIINITLCARVQSYAIIAIRLLITKCGVDEQSFAAEIITIMLVILKHEKQKLQEEALETLKSIALLSPVTYRRHYFDTTMKALKDVVMANYFTPSPKLYFRAKCLDCMSNLVRKVDPDKFEGEEAVEVIESLVTLEGNLNHTDYITRALILKALDQFCQCPRVNIGIFMNKMMPMLLRFAQLDVDLTANMPADDSLDGAKHLVENVRVRACNILSCCAVRSPLNFSPCISKVSKIFARWVGCSSFETRKASILALPNLLLSTKIAVQKEQTQRSLTTIIVQSLVEGLHKETYGDLSTEMLRILSTCIKTSSSFFTSQLIKIIADEINRIIGKVIVIEVVKAKEARTSEGRPRYLPNEEVIQDANNLVEATLETFSSEFLPYVDALMSNVATFWVHDIPDKVVAYIISIFNIILPRFPEKLPKYHNKYITAACDALREDRSYCQLHATRAIGIGAKFGGHGFKAIAAEAITRLHDLLTIRLSFYELSGGVAMLHDAAVAALGKILEFHRDSIDGSKKELVRNWLNFLPLKHDFSEAIYVHGLLSTMLRRSDKDLFGRNNENLPKVISVVKEILTPPRLATVEDINQLIDFLNQHDGMDLEQSSSKHYMPTT